MVRRRAGHWGLKAAVCAAIVAWQVYEMATASVFEPNEGNYLRYLALGGALFGLVASLLKLSAED
jgi:uncharacterized membrane protein YjfL (UPF0719 family)